MRRNTVNYSTNTVFLSLCRSRLGLEFIPEHRFYPPRLWRFDYANLKHKIAVEVEGGAFKKRSYVDKRTGEKITTIGGRHNSAMGYLKDIEKYNTATALGWKVLRATPGDLVSSQMLKLISTIAGGCE